MASPSSSSRGGGHFFLVERCGWSRPRRDFGATRRHVSPPLLFSWRRRRRKVVERPTSFKSRGKILMTTTSSSRHPNVRSRKPRDAPRDPHAALRDLKILEIVDEDKSRPVDVHSLFDETCEKNCVILMRSFG